MKRHTIVSIAITTGAIAGAATSLLLAPKKGSELRGDIAHIASNVKVKVQQTKDSLKTKQKSAGPSASDIAIKEDTSEAVAEK